MNELKGNPKIKKKIDDKLREFASLKEHPERWFSELCYCILTANSTAEMCMKVQQQVGEGFKNLPLKQLKKKMKSASCRFYNKRAEYIVEAREKFDPLIVKQLADKNPMQAREWLADEKSEGHIKGIGRKEASHFLRNIGYNIAIADFHIIDILKRYRFLPAGMVLNWKNYIVIEDKLKWLAKRFEMSLGELDLYLWYMETGKILK